MILTTWFEPGEWRGFMQFSFPNWLAAGFMAGAVCAAFNVPAAQLPFGFEQSVFASGLQDPNAIEFAPDGRLFVGERITGRVRVVDDGRLLAEPFATLPVPPEIPGRRELAAQPGFRYTHIYFYGNYRSSGLEGMAFDPEFERNGHVYFYFMNDRPRVNRVARLTASPQNRNVADPASLKILLDIPMHTEPTDGPVKDGGSHNGGALIFGPDGKLYITVGDGWNPAPPGAPQDLGLLIGKVLRLNMDGSVPEDNPFVGVSGARPEIWALGFRNPCTATVHPQTGRIYINDVVGGKETVFELVKGGNYQHPTFRGAGERQTPVYTASGLIAGGTWYFGDQFPELYRGSYFITDWRGHAIRRLLSAETPLPANFATGTRQAGQIKTGPDGALYWLSTTYETLNGTVNRIRFRPETPLATTPIISPPGGTFAEPVEVRMHSAVEGAEIRYTLDGKEPGAASALYTEPIQLRSSAVVHSRAFKSQMHPSAGVVVRFELTLPASSPDRELAGHWPLDDGSGLLARDISGLSRHGKLNEPSWGNSEEHGATLQFNGQDTHADLGPLDLEYPSFSVAAWIRPESFLPSGADNRIISKATGDSEQAHYWMLSTFRSGEVRLRFRLKTAGHTSTLIASSGTIRTGAWSHVAGTYDGSMMRLFLNGLEVGTLPKTGPIDRDPNTPVWIGANPKTKPPRPFHGAIRDVRLYNRALSEDDLRHLISSSERRIDETARRETQTKRAAYSPALSLAGDMNTGREIFMERCMACHRWNELGQEIGPDLKTFSTRESAWWLDAIIDPAREIAAPYWMFRVETFDDETIEGLLSGEVPDALILRPMLGDEQRIPRTAIRSFQRLDHSLMPQGLESGLTPEQMAGLLSFLRDLAAGEK
jgi:putative heme-binding domain-containing protein